MQTLPTTTPPTTAPTAIPQQPNSSSMVEQTVLDQIVLDQIVLDQIQDCLRQSNYRQMRRIQCEFRAGTAILQGRVSSFYAKQTAQELIRNIDGVVKIQNRIEVV